MKAGRCVAFYVDDGQGRRLLVGYPQDGVVRHPVILAVTLRELMDAIATLRTLGEELPP